MFLLYQVIISVLLLVSPFIIIYRIVKKKEHSKRFREKLSLSTKDRRRGKLIWFHGASVGEIMSIIPIIENYEKNKSISQILITSSTLSSSKIIKKLNFKKTIHQFYPIDHFIFTERFLNYWKPSIAIFLESEIWPSMFTGLEKREIPLVLLNARITRKTFYRWLKIKFFAQNIFNKISIAYPQNLETKFFLKKMKVNKINLLGNLKYIENTQNKLSRVNKNLKFEFNKKKIWVASSTHDQEEIFCAYTHKELKKKYQDIITIIIPRHIHRVNDIIHRIKELNLNCACHSSAPRNLKNVDIYIVDTFGETKKFHNIASSVFLGGSIIKRGGQNPLEAARFGAKVFHGPNVENFKDVYKFLKKLNFSKKIKSPKELASSIIFKKNKYMGIKIKKIGKKILKKTLNELDNLIKNEFKKT